MTDAFIRKIEVPEIELTDNTSVTKGVTFADGTRQDTAALEAKYAKKAISIPFTYAQVGNEPPEEYLANNVSGVVTVYKWSGSVWNALPALPSGYGAPAVCLWGYGGKLWLCCEYSGTPQICYYNGSSWSEARTTGRPQPPSISHRYTNSYYRPGFIHGSDSDNVWVTTAGSAGLNSVFKWNGSGWTAAGSTDITEAPHAIWTKSASDVWIGSLSGTKAFHWDGAAWTGYTWPGGVTVECSQIFGNATNNVIFLATSSTGNYPSMAFKWNGSALSDITPASWAANNYRLYSGSGVSGDSIMVGGYYDLDTSTRATSVWNGSSWTNYTASGTRLVLAAISGLDVDTVIGSDWQTRYATNIPVYSGGSWSTRAIPSVDQYGAGVGRFYGPLIDPLQSTETIPVDSIILSSHIVIDTPFVGTPLAELSVIGNSVLQDSTSDYLDLTVANQYTKTSIADITAAGKVQLRLTGSASAGVGRAVVEYLVPLS